MKDSLQLKVSRYMSYLLRHNPGNLKIDKYGFANIDELLARLKERFKIDVDLILEIVEKSERKRFEIVGNKIRALYGHTIPIESELREDKRVVRLYHGTTGEAAQTILETGLKPMERRWVHLSPTIEVAMQVGLRRTRKPVVLEIDVEAARRDGIRFYKVTDAVYLCSWVPCKYIKRVNHV